MPPSIMIALGVHNLSGAPISKNDDATPVQLTKNIDEEYVEEKYLLWPNLTPTNDRTNLSQTNIKVPT